MSEKVMNMSGDVQYSQAQIDYLTSQHFINKIDQHIRVISSIKVVDLDQDGPPRIVLNLEIYYDTHQNGTLSFNLHNYEYEEILEIAKNISHNEYILQEVDNLLSGDVIE